MKVTTIYVYPIKAIRGIALNDATIDSQGVQYDRRFMLFDERPDGKLKSMQLSKYPHAALFEPEIVGNKLVVRYKGKEDHINPDEHLEIPLEPSLDELEPTHIELHSSPTTAYRMGMACDAWFSARFGHPTQLVFIGNGKRRVLGAMSPFAASASATQPESKGWLSSWASTLSAPLLGTKEDPHWLTFTDCAPLLIASEASLRDVSARMSDGVEVPMIKFRPNIVVDGEGEDPFSEDFWGALDFPGHPDSPRLLLTSNCLRCTSLNVDYETGKPAAGELGTVLKRLMKDRRVDKGNKWEPAFGRYAFLRHDCPPVQLRVGDEVVVSQKNSEHTVFSWPSFG